MLTSVNGAELNDPNAASAAMAAAQGAGSVVISAAIEAELSALSDEDIDRMVKDAEAHAAEDAKRREAAEARNQAEQVVYSTEKFIADNGDKLPEAIKEQLAKFRARIDEAKKA